MIRMTAVCETAHRLAEEHVKRQGLLGPDVAAWREFSDGWVRRGSKRWDSVAEAWLPDSWNATEYRCIAAYATAALGYTSEMERPQTYSVPPERRGLWDGGNRWELVVHGYAA